MKVLTKDQLCAVLTACNYFKKTWPNEREIPALEAGMEKLRDNLRGRKVQEQRRIRSVAQRG